MIRFFKDICSFWIIPLIELIDAFHSYLHDFPINVYFRFPRKRNSISMETEDGIPFPWKTEFRFRGNRNSAETEDGIPISAEYGIPISVEYGIPFPWNTEFRFRGNRNSAETEDGIPRKRKTEFP